MSLEQIMLFLKKMWGQHADLHEQIPYVCMYALNKSTGVENNACSCVCVCVCLHEGKTLEELRVRPLHGVLRTLGEAILQQY